MTIKELREYISQFGDNDTVTVRMWGESGATYYLPHPSCADKPMTFKKDGRRFAVVGFFDNCLAHIAKRGA